ncbi:Signal transduction histidine kinase [Ruminococcus sp. YE71]|uniref:sensor histidine kinase n=1 Tax=unclassified Ruminococcus TaxID=2608920 RepID=UPI000886BCF7|nr:MULTISPECIES: HAMP domain-containing sensor histidine kinase [unclassified Ruminococcus]SDA14173.1 Signal transduction histidine kinase [Ruminococcus sp. YE78]SFW20675.1 Signal transduction histidine kinase [Ruminococcus sp. YE71]
MAFQRKDPDKPRFSLSLKFSLMLFLVMLLSAVIAVIALLFVMGPIVSQNTENRVNSLVSSMKLLEQKKVYSTSEIISICNVDIAEVTTLPEKSGERYNVLIDAAEHNCYIEREGRLFPTVTGYTVIGGDYLKIVPVNYDNIYWIATFVTIITMLVSIVLGSLMTMFVTHRILRPIKNLSSATAMVARGNFKVRVPESKDKEYNQLIKNFNRMAEELSGIETLRGDFISNVSHEFKTPLASIQGFAKLLQDETISDEDRREYTQIIINETGRLSKLTSDILRLSKLENQNTISNKKRFSIDEQIRKILLVLEPEWTKKNINLELELDTVYYFGNEELMAQIWQNVINNAIKFTPEGGNIGVRLFANEKNITAKITDDGPSIPPEVIEKIFVKFYQGDNSRKTEGNGLGLALVKRIIDLCNGKIYVENRYDGGVCFTVELPYVIGDMM